MPVPTAAGLNRPDLSVLGGRPHTTPSQVIPCFGGVNRAVSSAAQLWKTRLKCGYTVVLRGIEPLAYSIVSDYIRIVSDYNGCLAIPLNIDTITRSAHRPADWPSGGFGCVRLALG